MLLSDTFSSRWRRFADNAADPDPVRAVLAQVGSVHPGRHVGVRVPRAGDLVEQLSRDGADADLPAGAGVFGDHRGSVGVDLGERESGVAQVGNLGEERVVAAGGLHAAFDDVARHHGAGELVVVGSAPAEVCGGRADDHRRVGHPAGHDDVGAARQAVDDAPRAQVGVGGQRFAEPQFIRPGQQVVTLDMCDVDRDAQPLGQRAHRVGQARGVQPARIGDDAHVLLAGEAEALLELGEECLGVAAVGVLHAVAAEDQHRQLGEVVAGQVVQITAGEHLPHGGVTVAVEARTVPDANRRRHAHSCPVRPFANYSPTNR